MTSLTGEDRTVLLATVWVVDKLKDTWSFSAFMSIDLWGIEYFENIEVFIHIPAIRFGYLKAPNLRQKFQQDWQIKHCKFADPQMCQLLDDVSDK